MTRAWLLTTLAVLGAAACTAPPESASDDYDLEVDTESDLAWAQYRANRAFAEEYVPRCPEREQGPTRPRVLVSGFGRFQSQRVNATGLLVSELLPELDYPFTEPPPAGAIDPPEPQLAVGNGVVELAGAGEVELCAMVLPVFWDLAAYLVLSEAEHFGADLVVMNGVAGSRQALWLELGAVNRAARLEDGSNVLEPSQDDAPLVPEASEEEHARGNLASWTPVREAALAAIADLGGVANEGERFDSILKGARFAGYPRSSNTYLCNNVTYTVGYALDHPGEPITLMEASDPRESYDAGLALVFGEAPAGEGGSSAEACPSRAAAATPRWFMHWPSALTGAHVAPAAAVLRAVVDAQLVALAEGQVPSRGDNALAEIPPSP